MLEISNSGLDPMLALLRNPFTPLVFGATKAEGEIDKKKRKIDIIAVAGG